MARKQKEFQLIREWANEKGITSKGDLKTQTLKLVEEVGELAKAVLNNDKLEVIDAIGDATVVLVNVATLADKQFYSRNSKEPEITIEYCLETAYSVIKNRKGKMENGTFIKE